MIRIVAGVIAGFLAWMIAWVGSEKIISAMWPEFGTHQAAFQAAIENGGEFHSNSTMLFTHIILGAIVSIIAGFLSAMVSGENARAPVFLGILLLAMGLVKAVMSWNYVPLWYHVIFTAILLPMAVLGGRLKS